MTPSIQIVQIVLAKMLEHSRRDPHRECCGLLAGRDGAITAIFPASNVLASATAYEIAPPELFALFRDIRDQQLEFLGIYHSHPQTENTPSPTDVARAYYPDAAYFIISPAPDAPKPVRAFRIDDGNVTEILIEEIL